MSGFLSHPLVGRPLLLPNTNELRGMDSPKGE